MSLRRTLAALALLLTTLAFPAGVFANTNEPIAQTGGMEATFPLLGVPVTVGVTLDEVGKITAVTVNPTGVVEQTSATDTRVKLANADDSIKVTAKARDSKLSVAAKSKTLADFLGEGSWAADVFGTGTKSTVAYTIGEDAGKPTVTLGEIVAADGVTATPGEPKTWSSKKGTRQWAAGSVLFEHDGFRKVLRIAVAVRDDGTAWLGITLKGKDRQKLENGLANLAGERTWSAHLCDGTPVSVTYRITATGTVEFVGATGGETTEKVLDHGLKVHFDGTRVGVKVKVVQVGETDQWRLSVKGSSGRCEDPKDGDGDQANHRSRNYKDRPGHGDGDRKGDWARFGGRDKANDHGRHGDDRGSRSEERNRDCGRQSDHA
jgi:hypothetical protein